MELFVFLFLAGPLLWIYLLVAAVIVLAAVERDEPGWCSFFFFGSVILLEVFSPVRPLTYAVSHVVQVLEYFALYVFCGIVYSVVKWYSFIYMMRDRFIAFREKWNSEEMARMKRIETAHQKTGTTSSNGLSDVQNKPLDRLYADAKRCLGMTIPPKVSEHKSSIYLWVAYFPLSLLWTLINDPLRRMYRFIYNRLAGFFQKVSNNAFKDV